MSESPIEVLLRQPFLVVTGKGGVGKSAVSAALGTALAARGKKVLVIEVDPRENVHQLLAVPPSGGQLVQVDRRLWLQNLKPRQALDQLIQRQLGTGLISRRVLASETYDQLAQGAPGLRELGILDYALSRSESRGEDKWGPFDAVILDAPATGHGVSMLAAPLLVSEVVRSGPVGEKAEAMATFVADSDRLAVVVVTLAEEMPVQEAQELQQMLRERIHREANLLVVNGLYPPLPENLEEAAAAAGSGEPNPLAVWRRRRRVNERELGRLKAEWRRPIAELPLLPLDRGPELVAALRQRLEDPRNGGASS
ncbi:MAG: ArsA family ATPase [Acidobacteria bacterium]|nr:ArsA family ATPase [Acidobacteriota bacterium]